MNKEKQKMKYQYKQLKGAMMENVYLGFCKLKDKIETSAKHNSLNKCDEEGKQVFANNKRERHTIKKNL